MENNKPASHFRDYERKVRAPLLKKFVRFSLFDEASRKMISLKGRVEEYGGKGPSARVRVFSKDPNRPAGYPKNFWVLASSVEPVVESKKRH